MYQEIIIDNCKLIKDKENKIEVKVKINYQNKKPMAFINLIPDKLQDDVYNELMSAFKSFQPACTKSGKINSILLLNIKKDADTNELIKSIE